MGYADNKKKRRALAESDSGAVRLLKSSLIGCAVSIATAIVLWIVATVVAYSCNDPDSVISAFAFCAIYAAAVVGGFVSAKINGGGGLVCGAVSGVMITFLLLLVAVFMRNVYSSGYGALTSLLLRAFVVLASILGGLFGTYKRTKRRSRRR